MRIHQITDLHVPDDESDEKFSHIRRNVERQLAFVAAGLPDLLVISGDLTMTDGSEVACQWIRDSLPRDVPVIVIPGNHDDPAVIRRVFGSWPAQQHHDECSLVFVNTSSNYLPPEEMALLAVSPGPECLLFIHHPPHRIGAGFMSTNQPLLNCDAAARAIGDSAIDHVFCGHYHNQAQVSCDGFELYLTPSPAFQIALEEIPFTMEEFEPVVRTIDVTAGRVSTELVDV